MLVKRLDDLIDRAWRASRLVLALAVLSSAALAQTATAPQAASARKSADWIRDSVIYQIWERAYSEKGDFASITKDLDRFKALGVNVLWLMPVNPVGQAKKKGSLGSPYAVKDYYGVNPEYGTKEDLKTLVKEAHKRGLKVIVDVVINHTAWDNTLIDTHPEFYKKNAAGQIIAPVPEWADVAGLDYSQPAVRKYMIEMLKSWIVEYDLDGFRCDVALLIPTAFWEEARREIDKVKPDTLWLAEAEKPDLMVNAFDLDYSWKLHHAITAVVQGTKPASEIRTIIEDQEREYPRGAMRLRFIDNHDERRAIARLGEPGALAVQSLIFMLDGVPLIYNGMEAGDTSESGDPALFEKIPIFWAFAKRRPEFPATYRSLADLRRSQPALRRGSLVWLDNSDDARIVTFVRKLGNDEIVIALNLSNRPFAGTVKTDGRFDELTPTDGKVRAADPLPAIALRSWQMRVFRKRTDPRRAMRATP